jgi:hypothetical protein
MADVYIPPTSSPLNDASPATLPHGDATDTMILDAEAIRQQATVAQSACDELIKTEISRIDKAITAAVCTTGLEDDLSAIRPERELFSFSHTVRNLGNTCYFNSTMQLFASDPEIFANISALQIPANLQDSSICLAC